HVRLRHPSRRRRHGRSRRQCRARDAEGLQARGGAMSYDIAIIGAGHNGLVTATYLAKAGQKVVVLEASDRIGGAAVTREFAPGFKTSGVAHILHALHPKVVRDLGLKLDHTAIGTSVLLPESKSVEISSDAAATAASIASISKADAEAWPRVTARLNKI